MKHITEAMLAAFDSMCRGRKTVKPQAGDKSQGYCQSCEQIRPTTFEPRGQTRIVQGRKTHSGPLVAICDECGTITGRTPDEPREH